MGEPFLRKGFPHTPSPKLSHKVVKREVGSLATDGRCKRTACFCYRERLGTTKTPSAKRIVLPREEIYKPSP